MSLHKTKLFVLERLSLSPTYLPRIKVSLPRSIYIQWLKQRKFCVWRRANTPLSPGFSVPHRNVNFPSHHHINSPTQGDMCVNIVYYKLLSMFTLQSDKYYGTVTKAVGATTDFFIFYKWLTTHPRLRFKTKSAASSSFVRLTISSLFWLQRHPQVCQHSTSVPDTSS